MSTFAFDVEVTANCNQKCGYCFLGDALPKRMTRETADAVLRYIDRQRDFHPAWRPMELNLYGGEPFLNFPIVQWLVDGLTEPRICTIFTNGATATSEQVAWCQERGVTHKRSTAGCPDAAALTRPGTYTERWLREGEWWGDYAATHRLTVTPATARYVRKSVAWLHDNGYRGPIDLATDDYVEWPAEAQAAYEKQLTWLADESIESFPAGHAVALENFTNFGRCIFGQPDVMVLGCGAGRNTVGIRWDGNAVLPCHRFFRTAGEWPSLSDSEPRFSYIFQERFAADADGWETDQCNCCCARQCCPHGCLHVSLVTGGDMTSHPEHRCRFIRHYAKLARQINAALAPKRWWEGRKG